MEAYVRPIYSNEKEFEIFFRESAINYRRAESELYDNLSVFIEADEDDGETKKNGIFLMIINGVKKALDTIITTIKSFIEAITKSFGKQLTVDEYMNSDHAQKQFNQDIVDIGKQIDDEILAERKGVQAISKAVSKLSKSTNIPLDMILDDKAIANAIDKANAFAVKDGGTILKATAITVLTNTMHKYISDGLHLSETLKKSTEELERKRDSIDKSRIQYYEDHGNKIMASASKLTSSINKTTSRAMNYYTRLAGNIGNFKTNIANIKKNKK